MVFGTTTCKVDTADPATPLDELYEQSQGLIPDGYTVSRFCHTDKCVVHLTIRPTVRNRFEIPPELQPRPSSSGKTEPWSNERRLKFALASSSFKSTAKTWEDYCLDFLTSPLVSKDRQIAFCVHHFLSRGLPCHCGYRHNVRKNHEPLSHISNGISLDEHIRQFPNLDCGKAIVGLPPNEAYYAQAAHQNTPAEEDFSSQAFEKAYLEISAAFRPIKVMKLRPGHENWLHISAN
jgi:hypothetical protein